MLGRGELSRQAQDKKTETTARAASKNSVNDAIHVALIGTGGRCRHLGTTLGTIPGVRITAVCDVWDPHLAEGKKLAEANAFATKNYHELLDRKDIDAVLDRHARPLARADDDRRLRRRQGRVRREAAHARSVGRPARSSRRRTSTSRIVQVGTQQRSMPHIQKAAEIDQGRPARQDPQGPSHLEPQHRPRAPRPQTRRSQARSIGRRFLGNAPDQPFDDYRFRNWRWFWDFGGGIFTDLMVHWIDVAHWLLDLDHPEVAVSIGDHYHRQGRLGNARHGADAAAVIPSDLQAYFEGTFCNARNGAMIEFMGTKATLYIDRGRYELIPEREARGSRGADPRHRHRGRDFYDKPDGELLHLTNWVECIRSRKTPTAPAEAGVQSAAAAHLANKARSGWGSGEVGGGLVECGMGNGECEQTGSGVVFQQNPSRR